MLFTIALTDVQQQNAHFPLETHALLPHGSDYTTLVTSRVAALYAPAEDDDMNVTNQELEEFKYFCLMHKPLESRPMVTVNLSESLLGRKLICLFNISYIYFVSVIRPGIAG